ncbi:MAG: hypothetical protein JOZ02_15605 [Acidobacteria bacterium]|nr:hypothetical protein [Acidobacteriota bacterium]
MLTLKLTRQIALKSCLLLAALLCASHQLSAQISIGGINLPKPKRTSKPKTDQPERPTSGIANNGTPGGNSDAPQGDVQTNPNAPPDYNANLNVGDQAVAVDRFRDVKAVRIVGKSGAAYKVTELKSPDSVQWYSANSVYPYFDYTAFTEVMYNYKHYVTPYLECYGKKHNLGETKVTEEGYNAFGARHFDSAQDAQKTLGAEQPKLAELDGELKSKLGGAAPDTFLEYLSNPAIVSEIVSQRAEYVKCAVGVEDSKPDIALSAFLSDIKKAQEEAERYTPADFLYLVSAGGPSEQLLYAVSHRAREEWAGQWLKNPESRAEFDAEWEKLAAIATKKIPTYKPSAGSYRFRDPAGEKLLMGALKNPSALKIFRIGTDTAGWEIQRDSSNFPSYRYKTMKVYFRDPNDDHPYCRVVSARVKQDYAGGGRYNSEVYRSSVSEEIFGCP